MASLNVYLQQTQRFLREAKQEFLNPEDLISYVNRARRELALRTQCIRVLTPSSGQVVTAEVTDGGSGYTDPTVTISEPDFPSGYGSNPSGLQATALATVQAGEIVSIDIQDGGSGYFQPTVTITDSTGTDAAATLTVSPLNTLNQGQEVYPFSDIDLSGNPGCEAVFFIRSLSVIYSNYRYSLPVYSFSDYQAKIRQYPYQYQYVPSFASQFGQGTNGSFYVYPLPSQTYQFELDCLCLPSDLTTNNDYEAIPQPWDDAVPYFAAHMAYNELQQFNPARYYLDLYEKMVLSYSNYTRVGRTINPYGRY